MLFSYDGEGKLTLISLTENDGIYQKSSFVYSGSTIEEIYETNSPNSQRINNKTAPFKKSVNKKIPHKRDAIC